MAVAGNTPRPKAVDRASLNTSQPSATPQVLAAVAVANVPTSAPNGTSATSLPSCGPTVSQKSLRNDIGRLVECYRKVKVLAWPLAITFELASAVFSWEFPILTVSLWISLLLLCLYISAGQLLVIFVLLLMMVASMGYLSYTNQQLVHHANSSDKKQLSNLVSSAMSTTTDGSQPVPPLDHRAKLEIESQQKKQLLVEYRQLMHDLNAWFATVCGLLEKIEDVLLWRERWRTVIIYLLLYIGLIFMIYLPFRWFAMVTVNCAFAANPRCYANLLQLSQWVASKFLLAQQNAEEAGNHVNSIQQKENHEPHLQKDGPVSLHPLSENLDNNGSANSDTETDGMSSASTLSAVQKTSSTDASQPRSSASQPKKFESGVCYLCGTLFTSVLKRRRYCRYCGRDFCPKCCSRKLPRSALGATAPAAHTEKELVCNLCHIKLTGEDTGLIR